MTNLRVGGFPILRPENYPLSQKDKTGIAIPQLMFLTKNASPTTDVIKEIVQKKSKSEIIVRSLANSSFINSGKLQSDNSKPVVNHRKIFPIAKNNFLYAEINLNDKIKNLKIPNFGKLLFGDFSNTSPLYKSEPNFTTFDRISTSINYCITYLYLDALAGSTPREGQGAIVTFNNIRVKIEQKYQTTQPTKSVPNKPLHIKLKESKLVIDNNNTLTDNSGTYSLLNYLKYKQIKNNKVIEERDCTYNRQQKYFSAFIASSQMTSQQFTNLFHEFRKKERDISGKIFGDLVQDFGPATQLNNAYLTLSPYTTISHINLLVYAIIAELKIKNLNDTQYLIYDYLINKIYYAIKYNDTSFKEKSILKNNITYALLTSKDPRITNNKNDSMSYYFKNKFNRSEYRDKNIGNKITEAEYRSIPDTIRELYKKLNTPAINELLTRIFNMATYIRPLDGIFITDIDKSRTEYHMITVTIPQALFKLN